MTLLKPELEKIQEKFKQRKKKYESNPEKLEEVQREFQEQMTDLYRKHGAMNPLAGCFPTLLQFPLLIALYWAFSGPPFQAAILSLPLQASQEVSTKALKTSISPPVNFVDNSGQISRVRLESDIPNKLLVDKNYSLKLVKVDGKGEIPASEIKWHLLPKGHNPHEVNVKPELSAWANGVVELNSSGDTAKIKALKPTERFTLQAQIPETRGHQPFLFIKDLGRIGMYNKETREIHWDIVVLVALMGISFWFSNKLMTGSTPQPPSLDDSQQEMQKQMQTMMPIMFLVMMAFFPIPAGVFIYFIVSNVLQLLQTVGMNKFFPIKSTNLPTEQKQESVVS